MSVMKKHFELLLVKGERSDDNLHYGRISFPERGGIFNPKILSGGRNFSRHSFLNDSLNLETDV